MTYNVFSGTLNPTHSLECDIKPLLKVKATFMMVHNNDVIHYFRLLFNHCVVFQSYFG